MAFLDFNGLNHFFLKLKDVFVPFSSKGIANGVASLDNEGKLPVAQLPDLADDVMEFATKSAFPAQGDSGKIYIDKSDNAMYRWEIDRYIELTTGESVYADFSIVIHPSDWVSTGDAYTYTFTHEKVTIYCVVDFVLLKGAREALGASDIDLEKVVNGRNASVVLTVSDRLNADLPICIRVIDAKHAGEVYPISDTLISSDVIEEHGTVHSALDAITTELPLKATKADTVLETTLSRGRNESNEIGTGSLAFGDNVTASGDYSHAEGYMTSARGDYSHSEGEMTRAAGAASHAEGRSTLASHEGSHAEGMNTVARADYSHAEGKDTSADFEGMHAGGTYNMQSFLLTDTRYKGQWDSSVEYHDEDIVKRDENLYYMSNATGIGSINEDPYTYPWRWNQVAIFDEPILESIGNGDETPSNARVLDKQGNEYLNGTLYVNCEANSTGGTEIATKDDTVLNTTLSRGRKEDTTVGTGSIAFGYNVTASGYYSQAVGYGTIASNDNAYAEGQATAATGKYSHAEGRGSTASGEASHAEGYYGKASGEASHAEGYGKAFGDYSHAEGSGSASGTYSHAEGHGTIAYANYSHVEGNASTASGEASHVEGHGTIGYGHSIHVGGKYNVQDATANAWIAGKLYYIGDKVIYQNTMYVCETANSDSTFNSWKWGDVGPTVAEIIGNGESISARSNARLLDWDGNERLKGTLYVGCDSDSTGGTEVATKTSGTLSNGENVTINFSNGTCKLFMVYDVVTLGRATYMVVCTPSGDISSVQTFINGTVNISAGSLGKNKFGFSATSGDIIYNLIG